MPSPLSHNDAHSPNRIRNRNRTMLLAILAVFVGPIALAWLLNLNGVIPHAKTFGEQLQPMIDLRTTALRFQDGQRYEWAPAARVRRLLVIAPQDCTARCVRLAADLEKLRQLFGKDAELIHVLWMGPYPKTAPRSSALKLLADDAGIRGRLPKSNDPQGAPVYVIDPYGFVILRYTPNFDLADMRKDLNKLLKME